MCVYTHIYIYIYISEPTDYFPSSDVYLPRTPSLHPVKVISAGEIMFHIFGYPANVREAGNLKALQILSTRASMHVAEFLEKGLEAFLSGRASQIYDGSSCP